MIRKQARKKKKLSIDGIEFAKKSAAYMLKTQKDISMLTSMSLKEMAESILKIYGYESSVYSDSSALKFLKKYGKTGLLHLKQEPEKKFSDAKMRYFKSKRFLESDEWLKLRFLAIQKYGRRCMCCGAKPEDGAVIQVDHIKPRSIYPELAANINNLQVLCRECNIGKKHHYDNDFRKKST
jgi:5-methylcytosine-specific restriction endonuclease McrA